MSAPSLWLIGLSLGISPFIYLAGRMQTRHNGLQQQNEPALASRWLALITLIALWVAFGMVSGQADVSPLVTLGMVTLAITPISQLLITVTLTLSTLVMIYSIAYVDRTVGEEKYYAALVVMIGAMIGLVTSTDLFNLWLWFELLTVASFLPLMFNGRSALNAGVKYLVQTSIGSVLILLGISLVLLQTGTLNLAEIGALATRDPLMLTAAALFIVGFGVKVALVPLHTWLPSAHSQAPASISALLSGIVIEVALIALLSVMIALRDVLSWGVVFMAFGAANILLGNLMALKQTQVKRMLAYSSISQVGYILLGLGFGLYTADIVGAQGGFFHLLTHGLMKALAFLSAGAFLYAIGGHSLTREQLAGASRRYPLLSLALTLALLGLAGMPPLAGFMSKWQIFTSGVTSQDVMLIALVIFAALNSLLSLVYYVPVINALYREQVSSEMVSARPIPLLMRAPLMILALLIVIIGIFPQIVTGLTEPAASTLMMAFTR